MPLERRFALLSECAAEYREVDRDDRARTLPGDTGITTPMKSTPTKVQW